MVLSLQKMKSCTVPKFQFLSPGLKIIFKRNPAKYHLRSNIMKQYKILV